MSDMSNEVGTGLYEAAAAVAVWFVFVFSRVPSRTELFLLLFLSLPLRAVMPGLHVVMTI